MKVLVIMCVFLSGLAGAQDMHFSQFFVTPLLLNPANAAVENDLDIGIINRTQWKAVAQPFTSYGISVSGKMGKSPKKGKLGLGIDCYYDKSGDASFVSLQSGFNLAYCVKLSRYSSVSAGIKLNYNQRSLQTNSFQWGQQYDGRSYNGSLASGEHFNNLQSIRFLDVAGGLNYTFKKGSKQATTNTLRLFNVGISGFHLNSSNVNFYNNSITKLPARMLVYFQASIGINNSNITALPKVYYQLQGKQQELVMGCLLSISPKNESRITGYVTSNVFNIGLLYRNRDAVIAVMQYELKSYVLGISYDINTSKLSSSSSGRGAFELSLRYIKHRRSLSEKHYAK